MLTEIGLVLTSITAATALYRSCNMIEASDFYKEKSKNRDKFENLAVFIDAIRPFKIDSECEYQTLGGRKAIVIKIHENKAVVCIQEKYYLNGQDYLNKEYKVYNLDGSPIDLDKYDSRNFRDFIIKKISDRVE